MGLHAGNLSSSAINDRYYVVDRHSLATRRYTTPAAVIPV